VPSAVPQATTNLHLFSCVRFAAPGVVEVRRGLLTRPRSLSPLIFYDAVGCQLLERITQLPEYYLTRTESNVLPNSADPDCGHPDLLLRIPIGDNNRDQNPSLMGFRHNFVSWDLDRVPTYQQIS
jgi:Histidine-specific methyltransferase, SAM-dependent